MSESNNVHGGKRPGAGRKPVHGEPTKVVRVPESLHGHVVTLLSDWKEHRLLASSLDNVVELIRPTLGGSKATLPLFTSKVAAGIPSPADDHVEKRLNPSDYLVDNDSATFFVRVKGESMIDAGIFDTDVLVVDRSRVAQMGDIVLAILDGEFTVKTLGKSKTGIRLIPANDKFAIIEVKEGQDFEVWGVVTSSMRKFK